MMNFNTKLTFFFIALSMNQFACAMDMPSIHAKLTDEIIQKNKYELPEYSHDTRKLIWSPDGCYIAGSSPRMSPTLIVWNASGKKFWEIPKILDSCDRPIIGAIAFSPDSEEIAAVVNRARENFIATFKTWSGEKKLSFKGLKSSINCISYNNDGTKIAIGTGRGQDNCHLTIIDSKTGKITEQFEQVGRVASLAYNNDGTKIALGLLESDTNNLVVLDAITGNILMKLNHSGIIHTLRFHHQDPSKLITCSGDTCLLWDLLLHKTIKEFTTETCLNLTDMALSKDNKKLIIAKAISNLYPPQSYRITLFDTNTGDIMAQFEKEDIFALAWSPDMQKVVFAERFGKVHMITLPCDAAK